MARCFNSTGSCNPQSHYMVDISDKLAGIRAMVDSGFYFTINRARQYGKTTTINALTDYLKEDYIVIPLDFQRIGNEEFETASLFSAAFSDYLVNTVRNAICPVEGLNNGVLDKLEAAAQNHEYFPLRKLFGLLSTMCATAEKPVVMIIDEVDSAADNQVFLDFLAQLRSFYLTRTKTPTFQSVILAGVYDVKNIKRKIRPDEQHKVNSPWNIAEDFMVKMSFSREGIKGMLDEYEAGYNTGMDTGMIAGLVYDYTSGYPFLVSRICKLLDERVAGSKSFPDKASAWTETGFQEAVKILMDEKNTLFESLLNKLDDYPELYNMLQKILFTGQKLAFNNNDSICQLGVMFGFLEENDGAVKITNRIFETLLYNYFIAREQLTDESYAAADRDRSQFIKDGMLDMGLVLEKFVEHFHEIYKDNDQKFIENYGRKFFLLYLKPLINGTGNYYIEAQTRNAERTDIIVDYLGKRFIIEIKIWRGRKYNAKGEEQLAGYLDSYHMNEGYMLTFNFNKNKETGVKKVIYDGKILIEATV